MDDPKSRLIPLLCFVYFLVAAGGFTLAVIGHNAAPSPLPLIDETATSAEQLGQASRMMEQAQQQQPDQVILEMFYKGWLLEFDYRSLRKYRQPRFEGDSFERRIRSYNRTARHVDEIYIDAVNALALLSAGSLVLVIIMLWAPCYVVAILLAAFPVVVVFACVLLDINYDPLEICWVPFAVLGGVIFFLQMTFSFRFGRPQDRAAESPMGLMIYRRGILMVSLGIPVLAGALLMLTGELLGSGRSMRMTLGELLLGEEGIALVGVVVGFILILPGTRYMRRNPIADDA